MSDKTWKPNDLIPKGFFAVDKTQYESMVQKIQHLELALIVEKANTKAAEDMLTEKLEEVERFRIAHVALTKLKDDAEEKLAKFKDCVPVPASVIEQCRIEILHNDYMDNYKTNETLGLFDNHFHKFLKASEEV